MSLSYYQCKKRKMYSYLNINILDIIMEQINLKCFIDFVICFYPIKHTIMIKCRCFPMQYSEASYIRDAFIRKQCYPDGFSQERKKNNVILLHLAGNPRFRNRRVVWGTKPCFTMTIGHRKLLISYLILFFLRKKPICLVFDLH